MKVRWRILSAAVRDAWPLWLLFSGIFLASLLGWLLPPTLVKNATASDGVRYAGMMLQIGGLLTVAVGFREIRRMFNRPSVHRAVLGWFKRLAAAFRSPIPVEAYGTSAWGSGGATGESAPIHRASAEASLEERLAAVEANLDQLRGETEAKIHEVRQELVRLKKGLAQEAQERRTEGQKVASKIEELALGGLHLEMVGLVWLLFGILGTSIPDEVADWFFK